MVVPAVSLCSLNCGSVSLTAKQRYAALQYRPAHLFGGPFGVFLLHLGCDGPCLLGLLDGIVDGDWRTDRCALLHIVANFVSPNHASDSSPKCRVVLRFVDALAQFCFVCPSCTRTNTPTSRKSCGIDLADTTNAGSARRWLRVRLSLPVELTQLKKAISLSCSSLVAPEAPEATPHSDSSRSTASLNCPTYEAIAGTDAIVWYVGAKSFQHSHSLPILPLAACAAANKTIATMRTAGY